MAKSAIIIGASRGLGLGLTQELIGRGWHVVATRRGDAPALEASGAEVAVVDMDEAEQVAGLAQKLAGQLVGRQFDVVLVNAGVTGPKATSATVNKADFADLMWTNAAAPIRAARLLLPLLKPGGTLALMSSILGSVGGRGTAHAELYSASKAALNSMSRGLAVEHPDLPVLSLHPGWVKTDMGGEGADIDVETSVKGLADVLAARQAPGSRYVTYAGETLPW
jgi:NAD(P)-dependent dehydrogenase (short-subunit alcohol dehydrogenase family)